MTLSEIDTKFINLANEFIQASHQTKHSFVALEILTKNKETYKEILSYIRKSFEYFEEEVLDYTQIEKTDDRNGKRLLVFFKAVIEYKDQKMIISILGLKKQQEYGIKIIMKRFEEMKPDLSVAVYSSLHSRLGEKSPMNTLSRELIDKIMHKDAHVNPVSHSTNDPNVMIQLLDILYIIDGKITILSTVNTYREGRNKSLIFNLQTNEKVIEKLNVFRRAFPHTQEHESQAHIKDLSLWDSTNTQCKFRFVFNTNESPFIHVFGFYSRDTEELAFQNENLFDYFVYLLEKNFDINPKGQTFDFGALRQR